MQNNYLNFILANATHLVGARRRVSGGPGDLEAVEHGDGLGDLGDVGPEGGGRPPPDDLDVPLLEAVVGAADAQEEERQEDDGADDEQDLELAQRLQRAHLLLDGGLAGRGGEERELIFRNWTHPPLPKKRRRSCRK